MSRTVIATDDFNRADADLGAGNWSQLATNWGYCRVQTNYLVGTAGDPNVSHCPAGRWIGAGSFNNDQYASLAMTNFSNGGGSTRQGVIARASTAVYPNHTFYAYVVTDDNSGSPALRTCNLVLVNAGAQTVLATGTVSIGNGDRVEIECIGTTIRGLINQVVKHSVTDSTLTTGAPGVVPSSSGLHGDDWESGNGAVDPGGPSPDLAPRHAQFAPLLAQ